MFSFSSIEQYHAQLQEGTTSCKQAVEHYLQRINETARLNAFIDVYTDEALQQAERLDRERNSGKPRGILHGVIIALKDMICYKDHKVSAASAILKNFTSVYSATAVERLLQDGAIIIGNCNCDEFAMGSTSENSTYGRVLNALDESKVPGGSSGGSAVAVQAGLCMAALGTDTGGSVRQPASFCGITGFKPTYGRISRYGVIAYASSFDQIGIFGNSIKDIALLLEVMAGPDEFDSTLLQEKPVNYTIKKGNKKYRFAWFKEALDHPSLDPEIAAAIYTAIEKLQEDGHEVSAVPFELLDYIVPAYYVLTTAEASSNLARYDGVKYGFRTKGNDLDLSAVYTESRSAGFGKEVKRRIMLGTFVLSAGYYDAYFIRAQKVRKLLKDKLQLIFNEFDFILLPTAPTTAFSAVETTEDPVAIYLADIYTVMANLTGIPAISLPVFKHSNGLPFGLQLISRQSNELSLFEASKRLGEILPY